MSTGVLLCLLALYGCGQAPDSAGDAQPGQEPPALPEPVTSTPPDPEPAQADVPTDAPEYKPTPESLVLTPEDRPFADQPVHTFGEVHDADWLGEQPQHPAQQGLLPDLFDKSGNHDKVKVEGELLLDGSEEVSRMVDGVGVKIEINTDD
jgi:hypothetical protein